MKKFSSTLFFDDLKVTEEVVDYFEKHPEELDLIINKENFHASFLGFFFLLGLFLTIGARITQYFFSGELGEFINTVLLDVISEVGIAIFGGAVVAYFIEYLSKKQYQENINFRTEVKLKLEVRSQKTDGQS
ncbi:MAG: hypothetical protein AAF705_01355 [Bacteroidota bacterium]